MEEVVILMLAQNASIQDARTDGGLCRHLREWVVHLCNHQLKGSRCELSNERLTSLRDRLWSCDPWLLAELAHCHEQFARLYVNHLGTCLLTMLDTLATPTVK